MSKLLVVDDEQSICWGLTRLGESLGHEVVVGFECRAGVPRSRAAAAGRGDSRRAAARHGRPHGDRALPGAARQRADHRDHGLRRLADGGRSGAPRGVRLHRQAVRRRQGEGVAGAGAGESAENVVNTPPPRASKAWSAARPAMQEVYKRIALAAASDASVLLTGESGTGKELAARAIHRYSRRRKRAVRGGESGVARCRRRGESELFGHVRGAFAGADEDRAGRAGAGQWRHAVPGRSVGDSAADAGEVAAGAGAQ